MSALRDHPGAAIFSPETVLTPWGESENLRDRMLGSGPRHTVEEAATNQRERLFGAMVAGCASKGYEQTSVADLIATAGVSRRDFYKHFDDKEACFLATLEEIMRTASRTIAERARRGSPTEPDQGRAFAASMQMVVDQPAAARLCLVEAHVAGAAALERVEQAMALLETMLRKGLEDRHGGRKMPKEITSAMIGSLRKVVHTRLHRGREDELMDAVPELLEFVISYEPPPRPLRVPARRKPAATTITGGAQTFTDDPAERIIHATLRMVDEKGFQATTIAEIAEASSCSLSTFYATFPGKAEALDAALYSCRSRLIGVALPAYQRATSWPQSIRALTRSTYGFLATEPEFARVLTADVFAAGEEALERLDVALEGAQWPFREGRKFAAPQTGQIIVEAVTNACYALLAEQVHKRGPETLPEMVPTATYLALCPFLGAEEACEVARGGG